METITKESKRTIMPAAQLPCSTCGRPATHGCTDAREIASSDPERWRQFEETALRYGCADHVVISTTFYCDGRILPSSECVPEKLPAEPFTEATS